MYYLCLDTIGWNYFIVDQERMDELNSMVDYVGKTVKVIKSSENKEGLKNVL